MQFALDCCSPADDDRHFLSWRTTAILILALTLITGAIPVQAQSETTQQDVEAIVPKIEAYVEKAMAEWGTPGIAIGIIAGDELVYAKGFGVRELGSSAAVDPETVFQIGSTTKAFLGVTQAMLVEEGKLDWNDRVIDHDPEFRLFDPWVTREFRIADLLAQRSGLPHSTLTNMVLYGYSRGDVISALAHVQPVSSFRSTFAYQNAFHLVAERIVAKAAGAPDWEHFLQNRLLTPLGMTATSYSREAIEQAGNHATGHRYDSRETVVDPFAMFPYEAGGAGALNSNILDLSRWLRFHINQGELDGTRMIAAEALTATYEPRIVVSGPIAEHTRLGARDTLSYATGWIVHSTPEGRVIEHGGGTVGFVSHVAFDPDRRFGVIVLSNQSLEIGTGLALPFGRFIVDLLQGREPEDYAAESFAQLPSMIAAIDREMSPPSNPLPTRPLEAYTGSYESPTLGAIEMTKIDGSLSFELGPQNIPVRLVHWSGDIFVAHIPLPVPVGQSRVDRIKLRFNSDADGRIRSFDWLGQGDASGQPPFTRMNHQ